jgi:hypothetical protein
MMTRRAVANFSNGFDESLQLLAAARKGIERDAAYEMAVRRVAEYKEALATCLISVKGPCQTLMWVSPDNRGGEFSDVGCAVECWIERRRMDKQKTSPTPPAGNESST